MTVDGENDGRRIDNFLHSELPDLPRDRLHRLLRRGEVRVNGARARPGRRLRSGEAVRIPPVVSFREPKTGGRPPPVQIRRIEGAILFEDDRLLVLNKPSGVAVHGGSGISYGVIELLRAARPASRYLELAHRLDRETSGCLVVAKRRSALRALHEGLRRRSLDKRYLALLGGSLRGSGRRRVDLPLERDRRSGGERVVRVSEAGRASVTELATIAAGDGVTLAEVFPRTGRTHQIRVHCAALGHPVAGDPKYGDRALNRRLRSAGLKRLFLHAASIRIAGAELAGVTVRAALDPDLVAIAMRAGIPEDALARYRRSGPGSGSGSGSGLEVSGRPPGAPRGGPGLAKRVHALVAEHPGERDEGQALEGGGIVSPDELDEGDSESLALEAPRAVEGVLALHVGLDLGGPEGPELHGGVHHFRLHAAARRVEEAQRGPERHPLPGEQGQLLEVAGTVEWLSEVAPSHLRDLVTTDHEACRSDPGHRAGLLQGEPSRGGGRRLAFPAPFRNSGDDHLERKSEPVEEGAPVGRSRAEHEGALACHDVRLSGPVKAGRR